MVFRGARRALLEEFAEYVGVDTVQSLKDITCLRLQGVKEDGVVGGKGEILFIVEVLVG